MSILLAPYTLGLLYPNIILIAALAALKVFDYWSTLYILKHNGRETNPAMIWLIARLGAFWGLPVDFAIVAATAWFCYPYWYLLAGLVVYYGYMMVRQVKQLQISRPK